MKNAKLEMKRKGFTLVELLIVIVVIGVLSAMMMLSSTEAVSSAKAADIVSDLRNLKTAALAWYADNLDYVEGRVDKTATITGTFTDKKLNAAKEEITKYMNNDGLGSYTFGGSAAAGPWFVWLNVTDTNVFGKLKSRAKSTGLYLQGNSDTTSADLSTTTNTSGIVGMFIR